MTNKTNRRRGSALLEMTLVGIPLIFVLISTIEMARGMWIYHTLAYAVREGTRYTIVHGVNCGVSPNSCTLTVGQIATKIKNSAVGLYDTDNFQITMTSLSDSIGPITLTSALSNTTQFPSSGGDAVQAPITFTATYPFQSVIAMFWPGAGKGMQFDTFTLPASSQEAIQF